ncbi:sigma-70 family RNA polymerase sigma factor [Sodalinema gerasimenkoae]|uniref:sigma-70 family RNA polymerase sigma factor n=1 Tax=Sodalinema gerasimenkoae TaxID=2862348 RepID=UPI001FEAC01F|nr:sigma-70 family RNA polymerase sigma factor [Sodalinema gerasimenkoae]
MVVAAMVAADKPDRPADGELVRRCCQGDELSFRELYRRYQGKVRATLYQLCGREVLDDLVQETFLRVWRGLPKLRSPDYFSTWLYRIVWNVATDKRREFAKSADLRAKLQPEPPVAPPDLMELHYRDWVEQALQELKLDFRSVIVLHDLEDLPQKQVAEILNIPVGTVKSRLFHGRKLVRQYLEKQGVTF